MIRLKLILLFFQFVIDMSGVLIIVAIVNYWLLAPAAIIVMILACLRYLYMNTSRSIKRLEGICKSRQLDREISVKSIY